ncbi:MAG: hypothetical protein K9J13_14340 [Saprospiraceae bacterium]|nr:hypothetical protein [Saprospiraceae bacterium]
MKTKVQITLILVCMFSMLNLNGQAVISVQKNNVLYSGIENQIAVAVPGVAAEKIKISVTNGKISKNIDNINYLIIPKSKQTVIRVFSVNGNDTIEYGQSIYRVKQIPMPDLHLANQNISQETTIINRTILRSQAFLLFRYDNDFEFDLQAPVVTAFTISYKKNNKVITERIEANKIPNDIIAKILALPEGEIIFINSIIIKDISGKRILDTEYNFKLL